MNLPTTPGSLGKHTITGTATDSDGNQASDMIIGGVEEPVVETVQMDEGTPMSKGVLVAAAGAVPLVIAIAAAWGVRRARRI